MINTVGCSKGPPHHKISEVQAQTGSVPEKLRYIPLAAADYDVNILYARALHLTKQVLAHGFGTLFRTILAVADPNR